MLGGWSFGDDPDLDATTARAFWAPLHCVSVLPILAGGRELADCVGEFRLADLRSTWKLLLEGSTQHLLVKGEGGESLQLCVSGGDLLKPARLFTGMPAGRRMLSKRLPHLQALADLLGTGKLGGAHFLPHPRARRLLFVLKALDGRLTGLSGRGIATELFGPARVAEQWNDDGAYLRDRVRRAVSRGFHLMRHGYLDLLR